MNPFQALALSGRILGNQPIAVVRARGEQRVAPMRSFFESNAKPPLCRTVFVGLSSPTFPPEIHRAGPSSQRHEPKGCLSHAYEVHRKPTLRGDGGAAPRILSLHWTNSCPPLGSD
jgi:hypothetical protein